jgi:RNA polymerase-interacting CarD/CdnL/TRCF family regulator
MRIVLVGSWINLQHLSQKTFNKSNELIESALPTYEKEMTRAARLILEYELSFWNTIHKYSM